MEWADSCDHMGSCQLPGMESRTEERGRAGERWLSRTFQPVSSNTCAHSRGRGAMPLVELMQQPAPGNQCRPLPSPLLEKTGRQETTWESLFELTVGRSWQPCGGGRSSELLVTLNLKPGR